MAFSLVTVTSEVAEINQFCCFSRINSLAGSIYWDKLRSLPCLLCLYFKRVMLRSLNFNPFVSRKGYMRTAMHVAI